MLFAFLDILAILFNGFFKLLILEILMGFYDNDEIQNKFEACERRINSINYELQNLKNTASELDVSIRNLDLSVGNVFRYCKTVEQNNTNGCLIYIWLISISVYLFYSPTISFIKNIFVSVSQ